MDRLPRAPPPAPATSAHTSRAPLWLSRRPNPPSALLPGQLEAISPAGRWSSSGSGEASPAPHPRGGGSARSAAPGPFPAGMNQALWNP